MASRLRTWDAEQLQRGWGKPWHSQLFLAGMVVRKKGQQDWQLSLGHCHGMAVVCWPLRASTVHQQAALQPDVSQSSSYTWLLVSDSEDYEALPVEFKSPAHLDHLQRTSTTSGASSSSNALGYVVEKFQGMIAMQCGPPSSVLKVCAMEGFRGISASMLRQLCQDVGLEYEQIMSSLKIVFRAIEHICGAQSPSEMLAKLSKRQSLSSVGHDFWQHEEVQEALPTADQKIISDFADVCKVNLREETEFNEIKDNLKKTSKSEAKDKIKVAKANGTLTGKITEVPNIMHEEDARKYAPPGWKIYKSRKDNRWRVVHKDLPHVSRCWTVHGETRALAMCLQHAWSFHAKISKESCPYKWILEQAAL